MRYRYRRRRYRRVRRRRRRFGSAMYRRRIGRRM